MSIPSLFETSGVFVQIRALASMKIVRFCIIQVLLQKSDSKEIMMSLIRHFKSYK